MKKNHAHTLCCFAGTAGHCPKSIKVKIEGGDRPNIFTGVKPFKTFQNLLHDTPMTNIFQEFYTLKIERWYSFYVADQCMAHTVYV